MHGGSGSTQEEIKEAVQNGVIKMNIDTDTQWAYWQGNLSSFYLSGSVVDHNDQCFINTL